MSCRWTHSRRWKSATGDKIFGTLFDNTGQYSIGSSVTAPGGPDNLGGTWTYTVDSIAVADAAHQNPALSGFVYDTSYFDADNGRSFATYYGDQGLASGDTTKFWSGDNGLGSDGDLAIVDGVFFAIASGKYVLPDPLPAHAAATLATTSGAPVAGSNDGTSASMALLSNAMAAMPGAPVADMSRGTAAADAAAPLLAPPQG